MKNGIEDESWRIHVVNCQVEREMLTYASHGTWLLA